MVLKASDDTGALLPMVASGDEQAVHAFIDRYGALVWGMLERSLTPERAQAASRKVFRQIFNDAAILARESAPEVIVVASIAHRILAAEPQCQACELPAASQPVAHCLKSIPELVAVSRSLISLPHEQRRAVELCVLQSLSAPQVAQQMELDAHTVRHYLRQGLQKARSSFGAGAAGGQKTRGASL